MESIIESLKAGHVLPQSEASAKNVHSPTSPSAGVKYGENSEEFKREEGDCWEGMLFNKGTSSHYVNEALLTRVIEQVELPMTFISSMG